MSDGKRVIEFPLGEKTVYRADGRALRISNPVIDLEVKSARPGERGAHEWRRFRFLVDPGADFTMLPAAAAEQLGMDLVGEAVEEIRGAGGAVRVSYEEITLRIGDTELQLPCVFSSVADTPFVLGRAGFFSRFNITFDNRRKKIVLEEI